MPIVSNIGLQRPEPFVRIVNLNRVLTIAVHAIKQWLTMPHQPDHQLSSRSHTRINACMLDIRWFPLIIMKHISQLGMLFGSLVNLAGSGS